MGELYNRMSRDLKLRNLAATTHREYLAHLLRLAEMCSKPSLVSCPPRAFRSSSGQIAPPRSASHARIVFVGAQAILVTEEVLSELRGHPGVWISMTSTREPGRTSPGRWRATSIASSMVAAVTMMYPQTSSLTSTSGPSGRCRFGHSRVSCRRNSN